MVHQGQGDALRLEAFDDVPSVHESRFDDLECHEPLNRLSLFGKVDYSHPALTQQPLRCVGTEPLIGNCLIRRKHGLGIKIGFSMDSNTPKAAGAKAFRLIDRQFRAALRTDGHSGILFAECHQLVEAFPKKGY